MGKKFKIQIRDKHPESYFRELRNKFLHVRIRDLFDPRMEKSGFGIENLDPIPDSQHCTVLCGSALIEYMPDPETESKFPRLTMLHSARKCVK